MNVEVILEWTYTPPDCLEQAVAVTTPEYDLAIEGGRATARLDPQYYDDNPHIRDVLQGEMHGRLAGARIITRVPFELSGPAVTYVRDDGTKTHVLEVACGAIAILSASADIQVVDADGNVVRDTRQERVDDKRILGELCVKHGSDPTLQAIQRSFDTALRDPDDELVHLWEIPEALATRFRGEPAARSAVGVGSRTWSRMGRLCNREPLRQGRHRGRTATSLRDATTEELEEVRSTAALMMRGYLNYLESYSP